MLRKVCGIKFAVPDSFYQERRKKGPSLNWHCPNGHVRAFGKSDVDVLRRERDNLKQQQARLIEERDAAQRAENEQYARANKAEATAKRLKKRSSAGTCPCCARTFSNMAEHMKHMHPEFVCDGGAKVVPLKRARA